MVKYLVGIVAPVDVETLPWNVLIESEKCEVVVLPHTKSRLLSGLYEPLCNQVTYGGQQRMQSPASTSIIQVSKSIEH